MESFLFMIIIGIVSIVFRNAKGKKGESRNKTFSKGTFEEIRNLVKKQLDIEESRTNGPLKPKNTPTVPKDNLGHLEKKYLQLKQEPEVKRIGMTVAQHKSEKVKVNPGHEDGSEISLNPDEKALINGIIWAEILGEPRSKKPYRPRNG
ncbi:hypothetical protein [Neobacillus sp. SuZ13]|uniref:hypothetical protein n=1 Tax=Neobacillus sp. SuZ13 TaxID=3047875 RepID=UPI0024BF1F4A|nr:hypothetical protein [Neobacillus sp. SuZ13]WHY65757.1 hypothetical protein QNH17_22105 [Neobacillus sp. SuZ13]